MLGRQLKSKDLKIKEKIAKKGNRASAAIEHSVLQTSRWMHKAIWGERGVPLECLDTGLPVNGNPQIICRMDETKGSARTHPSPLQTYAHIHTNQKFATSSLLVEQESLWCEMKGVLPEYFRTWSWWTPMIRTELQKTTMDTRLSCYSMANAPLNHQKRWASSFWCCSSEKMGPRWVIRSRWGRHQNALLSWSIKDLLNLQDKWFLGRGGLYSRECKN